MDPLRIPEGAFSHIVDMVIRRSPLQKKKLLQDLSERGDDFFRDAERFARSYTGYLETQGIPLDYAVEAYLEMCRNMMRCQIEFLKTGRYPISEHHQAVETVYHNEDRMKSYMIGLAISQFLWRTHYEMFRFFRSAIEIAGSSARNYLEIGPGHGLFLKEAMHSLPGSAALVAVDISPVSIAITRSILRHFFPVERVLYRNVDVMALGTADRFDFVTMGEVLEHVDRPDLLLGKIHDLLSEGGNAFVSTCVNAPAIDHIYHFRTVNEIRQLMEGSGLSIEGERVLPVENLPMTAIIEKKITINYCAMVRRKTA